MRAPPLLATFFTIAGVVVLCGLGAWQWQRLEWKTAIVQKLEAEYAKDASNIFLAPETLAQDFDFRRGTLRGVYDFEKQIRVGPRVYEKIPGYDVLTPLQLSDGSVLLVDRGWVPEAWRFADEENPPTGTVSVTGLLRKPPPPNPFTPQNLPEKGEWYNPDPAQIAAATGIPRLHAYILYLEAGTEVSTYPLAAAVKPEIYNAHLQYAVFWFTMAGLLLVMYFLRFIKKEK